MRRHGSDVSAAKGAGGSDGVRRGDALSLGGGSQGPLDFLHVRVPDVVPRLTSPGGSRNENEDVSKNYTKVPISTINTTQFAGERLTDYPGGEATRSDGLKKSTDYNGPLESEYRGRDGEVRTGGTAANDTTEGGSSHNTGGEPQNPENGQPANLKGNPGRDGAITDATDSKPRHRTISFRQTHRQGRNSHGESRNHVEE